MACGPGRTWWTSANSPGGTPRAGTLVLRRPRSPAEKARSHRGTSGKYRWTLQLEALRRLGIGCAVGRASRLEVHPILWRQLA